MTIIDIFEKAISGQAGSLKDYGINPTVFWAYRKSMDADNPLIDFYEVIWDDDVEPIVETCTIRMPRVAASMKPQETAPPICWASWTPLPKS